MRRLGRGDLPRETHALARALIGSLLVRRLPDGQLIGGRIVETEAYPPGDPAAHAFRGQTPRNSAMFLQPLHAYVYFIYGTVWCFNVTSESRGIGAAVLIRALEPRFGVDVMRVARGQRAPDRDLTRGPGRLCAALAIDREIDGVDLARSRAIWLATDGTPVPLIGQSTRIGLTKAVDEPHRYFARGSTFVSGPRALSLEKDRCRRA